MAKNKPNRPLNQSFQQGCARPRYTTFDNISRTGFDIVRYQPHKKPLSLGDLTDREFEIVESVKPYTMTGDEGGGTLMNAVRYITEHKIPGNIAECGVWRGGSMMAVARALMSQGDSSRHLYLYDTFEGMSEPTE